MKCRRMLHWAGWSSPVITSTTAPLSLQVGHEGGEVSGQERGLGAWGKVVGLMLGIEESGGVSGQAQGVRVHA